MFCSQRQKNNQMADTRPSKINFFKIIHLCILAIINPARFIKEEEKDNAIRTSFTSNTAQTHRIYSVIKAFWCSLGLIILSSILGSLAGLILRHWSPHPAILKIIFLQGMGACLLLWGTLFIRGWEVQTFCGVTLTERVNQWIYRFLYCKGTIIIICSLVWSLPVH